MVNLKQNKMTKDGTKFDSILKWEVWFQTPFGLIKDLKDAIKRCEGLDVDPDLIIRPVPVAVAENDYEVVSRG